MTSFVILNPTAGGGAAGREQGRILARLKDAVGPIEVATTERPLHATELARSAWAQGFREFVAIGGDGTLNEVVNGVHVEDAPGEAVVAVVNAGTGGDFRRTLGIGDGVDASIERVRSGSPRSIDVGRISFVGDDGRPERRLFLNIASFGLSGVQDRRLNRARAGKRLGGSAFVTATLVSAFLGYRFQGVRMRIDGQPLEARIMTVAVANGRYFAQGMMFAPDADPADGLLDVVVARGRKKLAVLRDMPSFYAGEHLRHPGVETFRAREIVAEPAEHEAPVLLDIDGESPGRLPARFELLPAALRVRC